MDHEKFSMDDDYEGGEWIDGEFYYAAKKKKRKYTKDDAIYGVFADGAEDPPRMGKGGRNGGKSNVAGAFQMSFVSGKTMTMDKDDEKKSEPDLQVKNTNRKARGAAKSTPALGLGSFSGTVRPTHRRFAAQASSASAADPSSVQQDWEKYTSGRGSKLLAKMGYKGGALGAEGSGIKRAIEVKVRPQGQGLGFGGFKERTRQVEEDFGHLDEYEEEAEEDEEEEEKGVPENAVPAWKKGSRSSIKKPKKEKVIYKTVEELRGAPQKQVVIDMTAKEGPRVITDVTQLSGGKVDGDSDGEAEGLAMELRYNLKMVVDMTQSEFQKVDNKLQWEKDQAARLQREKDKLEKNLAIVGKERERLFELREVVRNCIEKLKDKAEPMSLLRLGEVYDLLQGRFPVEFNKYNLSMLAASLVFPHLKQEMTGWQPLEEPSRGSSTVRVCRMLLAQRSSKISDEDDQSTPRDGPLYGQLVRQIIMPPIRSDLTNRWNPREPDNAIALVEVWASILPESDYELLKQQVLIPKLRHAVEAWDPRVDTLPIHAWIHPWLPIMHRELRELYSTIRQKLRACMMAWHPMDQSAVLMLRPWNSVFGKKDMANLLAHSVEPKLAQLLATLPINPQEQDITPFERVMDWEDLLPRDRLAKLLVANFFPRWMAVLQQWLALKPNYAEVSRWYVGWKKQFSASLVQEDDVRSELNDALKVISSALS